MTATHVSPLLLFARILVFLALASGVGLAWWKAFSDSESAKDWPVQGNRLLRWLLYGVVVGMLPFIFPLINILVSAKDTPPFAVIFSLETLDKVFGHGDLFLVSATLVAAAAGELIGSGDERETRKIMSGFCCIATFLVSAVWYGIVANKVASSVVYNVNGTTKGSLIVFLFAVVTSSGCMLLSKGEKKQPTDSVSA